MCYWKREARFDIIQIKSVAQLSQNRVTMTDVSAPSYTRLLCHFCR
jgi:hypothetical protein